MRHFIIVLLILLSILIVSSCKKRQSPPQKNQEIPVQESKNESASKQEKTPEPPSQPVETNEDEGKSVYDLFVDKDRESLSYKDYTIFKRSKNAVIDYGDRKATEEVSYSVLKRGKTVIKRFEGSETWLTASDFGIFNFTGEKSKQLIVAQTLPKGGRFWIIRLSPQFRVLLDTNDYGAFREEPYILDIDKDGTYEIKEAIWDFDGVKSVATVNTPQPLIIFKYDKNADRFFPANHIFWKYALNGIEKDIKNLKPTVDTSNINDSESYYRQRVEILLQYIFAGKEKIGWAFFDKHYDLPDKQKVKSEIRAALRKQLAYRFIYSKRAWK